MRNESHNVNGSESTRSDMRIVFVTRTITAGGAERQLLTLAGALAERGHDICVLSFYAPLSDATIPKGVRAVAANKRGRWDVVRFACAMVWHLRNKSADIIHPYLPSANILVAVLSLFIPKTRIVFGLRASTLDLSHYDWLSRTAYRLERVLSRRADLLIANADSVRADAIARGYPPGRIHVVYNGIDTSAFYPDRARGEEFRKSWHFRSHEFVVGNVGRFDPMKDQMTFLAAIAQTATSIPSIRAVVAGTGPAALERRLRERAEQLGIANRVVWIGHQQSLLGLYNALDVLCLTSVFGEGFPNVVAEAMACEIPCIATDVGDVKAIVGRTGYIVPPGDILELKRSLGLLSALPLEARTALGKNARRRILDNWTVELLADRTIDALSR